MNTSASYQKKNTPLTGWSHRYVSRGPGLQLYSLVHVCLLNGVVVSRAIKYHVTLAGLDKPNPVTAWWAPRVILRTRPRGPASLDRPRARIRVVG